MTHEDNEDSELISSMLLKDLDIKEISSGLDLQNDFHAIFTISPCAFKKVAKDVMALTGVSGDWELSLKFSEQFLLCPDVVDEQWALAKIWQLRCLVELDRMAEALALSQLIKWPNPMLIHANYLTGRAFEKLEMTEQARQRFEAVFKENPRFRDIADRLQQE